MVALLENEGCRSDKASQRKRNALVPRQGTFAMFEARNVALGSGEIVKRTSQRFPLAALASALAEVMEKSDVSAEEVRPLNAAVGLEERESASR